MKTTAKDLRFYSKQILEAVKRPEEMTITYSGRPCVRLVPYREEPRSEEDELFGIWKDHKEDHREALWI